jgi:hypothetical protein
MSGLDAARARLAENGARTGGKWALGALHLLVVSLLPEAAGAAAEAPRVSLRDVGNGLYGSDVAASSLGLFLAAAAAVVVVEILSSLLESYAFGAEHTRHFSAVDFWFSRVQTRHVQSTASCDGVVDLPPFFCRAAALGPHSHDLKDDIGKEAFVFSLGGGGARRVAGTGDEGTVVVAVVAVAG